MSESKLVSERVLKPPVAWRAFDKPVARMLHSCGGDDNHSSDQCSAQLFKASPHVNIGVSHGAIAESYLMGGGLFSFPQPPFPLLASGLESRFEQEAGALFRFGVGSPALQFRQ